MNKISTPLFSIIMYDGSEHFAKLPQSVGYDRLLAHIQRLPGVEQLHMTTDHITEAWIDFDYHKHHFSINDQCAAYWFFVDDRNCPTQIKQTIVDHVGSIITT